jgi:hypothetical protein
MAENVILASVPVIFKTQNCERKPLRILMQLLNAAHPKWRPDPLQLRECCVKPIKPTHGPAYSLKELQLK